MALGITFGVIISLRVKGARILLLTCLLLPLSSVAIAYMREGVTYELKSHSFVSSSWNYVWCHYLSKSERGMYPLVNLSFAVGVIKNSREQALKVKDIHMIWLHQLAY
mgnify:CR=1 FL=1